MRKIVLVFIVALLLVFVMCFSSFAVLGDINEDDCTVIKEVLLQDSPIIDGKLDKIYAEGMTLDIHGTESAYYIEGDSCEDTTPVQPKPLQREEGEIVVVLDGNQIMFDVKPTIKNGTTLVPIRAISEALDATVEWDQNTRTVTVKKDNTTIKLCIDSITMYVDGNSITLNHPAVIIDGRTLVPVRAISEAFGCLVGWDANTKQVSVIADTLYYCMLYTPDGQAKSFYRSMVADQLKVGWYEEPVQILYAHGKSAVFKKSEVASQLKVGWYEEPVVQLYTLEDRTTLVVESEVASYLAAGWYEEPVQTLYAPGTSKVFQKSEVVYQLEIGWREEPVEPVKICIDAGHYGKSNRSTVYPSYYESDMTWKLHLLLKKELEAYGFEVITTREDKDVDLKRETRGEMSEGCDLFISLHSNACGDESVDKAVIIPFIDLAWMDIDDKSRAIAAKFGPCIMEVMGLSSYQIYPFRDEEEDRDGNGVFDDEYYSVLHGARNVGTPGVILEHGFHTNTKCAKWLSNDSNLEKLAKAEAAVVADFFGVIKVEK